MKPACQGPEASQSMWGAARYIHSLFPGVGVKGCFSVTPQHNSTEAVPEPSCHIHSNHSGQQQQLSSPPLAQMSFPPAWLAVILSFFNFISSPVLCSTLIASDRWKLQYISSSRSLNKMTCISCSNQILLQVTSASSKPGLAKGPLCSWRGFCFFPSFSSCQEYLYFNLLLCQCVKILKKNKKHISSNCNNIKIKKFWVTPVFSKSIRNTPHLLSGSKCKHSEEEADFQDVSVISRWSRWPCHFGGFLFFFSPRRSRSLV